MGHRYPYPALGQRRRQLIAFRVHVRIRCRGSLIDGIPVYILCLFPPHIIEELTIHIDRHTTGIGTGQGILLVSLHRIGYPQRTAFQVTDLGVTQNHCHTGIGILFSVFRRNIRKTEGNTGSFHRVCINRCIFINMRHLRKYILRYAWPRIGTGPVCCLKPLRRNRRHGQSRCQKQRP